MNISGCLTKRLCWVSPFIHLDNRLMNLFHFYQTRVRAALERLIEQGQLPSDLDLNIIEVQRSQLV